MTQHTIRAYMRACRLVIGAVATPTIVDRRQHDIRRVLALVHVMMAFGAVDGPVTIVVEGRVPHPARRYCLHFCRFRQVQFLQVDRESRVLPLDLPIAIGLAEIMTSGTS